MSTQAVPPLIKTVAAPKAPATAAPRRIQPPRLRPPRTRKAWEGIFRGVIIVLMIVSIVLAWWSYAMVLTPRLERSRRLTTEAASLLTQVEGLERKYSADQIETLNTNYTNAQSMLLDEKGLQAWLAKLGKAADPLGIGVKPSFSAPQTQSTNYQKLAVLPATVSIEVTPTAEGTVMKSRFARLLQWVDKVANESQRIDLVDLTVTGGTNSSDRAVMTLNLWVGEEPKK